MSRSVFIRMVSTARSLTVESPDTFHPLEIAMRDKLEYLVNRIIIGLVVYGVILGILSTIGASRL